MFLSKGKQLKVFLINKFSPPDFAPTGQLLDDLSKRICSKKLFINIITGYPKYALKIKILKMRMTNIGKFIEQSSIKFGLIILVIK